MPAWQLHREYVYYPDTFVPLSVIDEKGSCQYHNDPNGFPTRLTRADGTVVWAAHQEVWGRARVLDAVSNQLRLQGQYEDEETGLHYNRHRYFDPVGGQFVSQDPLRLAPQENLSAYGPNAQVWIDPLGLAKLRLRKPGHLADWSLLRPSTGQYMQGGTFSGADVPGGGRLTYEQQLCTHTEAKVLDRLKGVVQPGEVVPSA